MTTRRNARFVVGGAAVAAVLVGLGAAGAIAASGAWSPSEERKAVIEDAAGQLGVDPDALSDALKQALENRIDAAVEAGEDHRGAGGRSEGAARVGDIPLFGGFGPTSGTSARTSGTSATSEPRGGRGVPRPLGGRAPRTARQRHARRDRQGSGQVGRRSHEGTRHRRREEDRRSGCRRQALEGASRGAEGGAPRPSRGACQRRASRTRPRVPSRALAGRHLTSRAAGLRTSFRIGPSKRGQARKAWPRADSSLDRGMFLRLERGTSIEGLHPPLCVTTRRYGERGREPRARPLGRARGTISTPTGRGSRPLPTILSSSNAMSGHRAAQRRATMTSEALTGPTSRRACPSR